MRETIEKYFSEPRHHLSNNDYKLQAKSFIETEFERHGLEVVPHNFVSKNYPQVSSVMFLVNSTFKGAFTRYGKLTWESAHAWNLIILR